MQTTAGEQQYRERHATDGNWAVILIDMQTGFIKGGCADMIRAQIEVIRMCAERDVPLVVLEYYGEGKTLPGLEAEISRVKRTTRMTKHWNDGFKGGRLCEHLEELDVQKLLLMGVNGSFCVLDTATSALNLGYEVATSLDLVTNTSTCVKSKKDMGNVFSWFNRNGILVQESSELAYVL